METISFYKVIRWQFTGPKPSVYQICPPVNGRKSDHVYESDYLDKDGNTTDNLTQNPFFDLYLEFW